MNIYVCDTSSLAHTATSLHNIGHGKIVIPIAAYEELDSLNHTRSNNASYNARQVIKLMDKLQEKQNSDIIKLDTGSTVQLDEDPPNKLGNSYNMNKVDNRILNTALHYSMQGNNKVYLVSNDAALRVKARKKKINTIPLSEDIVDMVQEKEYSGWSHYDASQTRINKFYNDKQLTTRKKMMANEFLVMKSKDGLSSSALGRYDKSSELILPLHHLEERPWGISPKNVQQKFAMEAILNPDIQVIALPAPAGTGKSLISIACGGHLVEKEGYSRMCIFKPLHVIGPDIGYLPGNIEEKLDPHMESVYDSLDYIFNTKSYSKDGKKVSQRPWQYLIDKDMLELKAITHLRGRSLPNIFILVDEAQNLAPSEVRTIITRCGEGTKIIFAGDPQQIDNRYLDAQTNGLTYLINKFKDQECFATVRLEKSERSMLAELGAQLL